MDDVIKPGLIKLADGVHLDPMQISSVGLSMNGDIASVRIHRHNVPDYLYQISFNSKVEAVRTCDHFAALINEARTAAQ